jgi:hypothetical protein
MAQDPRRQERARQWGQVVARAWTDEGFKQRLLADPAAVLAEQGIAVPAGVAVEVHEATPAVLHLVLPPPPSDKLNLEQLEQVAGGFCCDIYCICGSGH